MLTVSRREPGDTSLRRHNGASENLGPCRKGPYRETSSITAMSSTDACMWSRSVRRSVAWHKRG